MPGKIVQFDEETFSLFNLLRRERRRSFQQIADKASRDLLEKLAHPLKLKDQCARASTRSRPSDGRRSMASYVAASKLRGFTLKILRTHVPSVIDLRIACLPGPFRPRNWKVEWLNVLAEDYGRARDKADELEAMGHFIAVPDGHRLDGQVVGKEF